MAITFMVHSIITVDIHINENKTKQKQNVSAP